MHGKIISDKGKERRENESSSAISAIPAKSTISALKAIFPLFILGILLVLCICQTASAAAYDIRITEFCPDTYLKGEGDEYFVLGGGGSLSGVEVSDGEGSVGFPKGAAFSGAVTVAREGAAFRDVS